MKTSWMKVLATVATLIPWSGVSNASVTEYEEIIYYHNDALGSPIAATDANGDVLWREEYSPYGSRLLLESQESDCSSGTCIPVESAWDEKQWFTGKLEESRSGIQYFGARWYEPELGRFLSVDPVQFREDNIFSFNRYAYANNNPYRYFDPDGREPKASGVVDMQRGSFLNSRSDCPGRCTLVHNPDGRKMYVPSGIAHQVVSANAKGLTLDQEQKTPSGIDGLKAIGTATSIAIILSPASAVVAGPVGLAADLAVGAAERDPLVLMPAAVGSGVKAGLKAGKIRESVSARISAGAELLIGRKKEETQ